MAKAPTFEKFFHSASALIVETAATSRQAIRKLLSEAGLRPQAIHEAATFDDAATIVGREHPRLIFADFDLLRGKALELSNLFKKSCPSSEGPSIFILLTETAAPPALVPGDEFLVDAAIAKPFNYAAIADAFHSAVAARHDQSSAMRTLEAAWEMIETGAPQKAISFLATVRKTMAANSPLASALFYLEGRAVKALGHLGPAAKCFEAGLKLKPTHAGCLWEMLDLMLETKDHLKAFEVGSALLKAYPADKRRLIDMVRVALVTGNHAQITSYCDRISAAVTAEEDATATHLAAGLAICGKRLVAEGKNDEALKALRKAEQLCNGKAHILTAIIEFLYQRKFIVEAESMLNRLPDEVRISKEIRMIELEHFNTYETPAKVLQFALKLLSKGIKTQRLYELAIEKSIAMGRPDAVTQDMVKAAAEAIPEAKAHFQTLFETLRTKKTAA